MPIIPLDVRKVAFTSDQGVPVSAFRVYVELFFGTKNGPPASYPTILDSGAPLSVLPYSFWYKKNVQWYHFGNQLLRRGRPDADALKWFGVPCDLGLTEGYLVDPTNPGPGADLGPYWVLAKFARMPHRDQRIEAAVVLGLSFLADNLQVFSLEGTGAAVSATLRVP